jgi:hypothetical protein
MIEEFMNRKKYSEFDLQTLRSIGDENLEQALLDYLFAKIASKPGQARKVVGELSPEFQVFYVSWLVEAEVRNGGFNQFFWNPSSQFAADAPDALEAIGDAESAEITWRALAMVIKERETMIRLKKIGTVEAFSESYKLIKLGDLDTLFWKSAAGLSALRVRYVRQHEEAFVTRR